MSEEEQAALLGGLTADLATVKISDTDRAMLGYAVKLTRTPGKVVERDVGLLRTHGFDDRAIHDVCSIVAYFAFVNRMADGLGVDLEDQK